MREVIVGRYLLLYKYMVGILVVFDRLVVLMSGFLRLFFGWMVLDWFFGMRDFLKWCGRLDDILCLVGVKIGEEFVMDIMRDWMFLEVVDCFVSNIYEIVVCNLLI